MPQSTHNAYISVELLLSVLILGIGFKIFINIKQEGIRSESVLKKAEQMFFAQKSISDKSNSSDFGKVLLVSSQKNFRYQGRLIEVFDDKGIYYQYFYPQKVSVVEK